jgi:hypothetical protein
MAKSLIFINGGSFIAGKTTTKNEKSWILSILIMDFSWFVDDFRFFLPWEILQHVGNPCTKFQDPEVKKKIGSEECDTRPGYDYNRLRT